MVASDLINFGNRNRHVMHFPRLKYLIDGAIANRASDGASSAVSETPMINHGHGNGHRHDHGRPQRNIAPVMAPVMAAAVAPVVAAKGRLASGAGPL